MSLADEMVLRARAEARQQRAANVSAAALDALRTEATQLFEELPEPPLYRRANDPARERAKELLPGACNLLARLLATADAARGDERLPVLVRAVEAHLRALAAIGAGEIGEGDNLAREAWEQARAATTSGSFFRMESAQPPPPVYDRVTGVSRYDPRPEPGLTVQLFCANGDCRHPSAYSVVPRYSTHRFTCPVCHKPFTGHFAEVRAAQSKQLGKAVHYTLQVEPVGGGASVLEFDDASQAELSVAARDLIVLLYSGTGSLAAVENLTTGTVLWVVPKSACFVATVAFGEGAPELETLRAFRDRVLLRSSPGRAFVRVYYRHGPGLAARLSRHRAARAAVRWLLAAMVRALGRGSARR